MVLDVGRCLRMLGNVGNVGRTGSWFCEAHGHRF